MVPGTTGRHRQTIRTSQILARVAIPGERIAGAIHRAEAPAGTLGAAATGLHLQILRHQGTLQAVVIHGAAGATAELTPTVRRPETLRREATAGQPAGEVVGWIRQLQQVYRDRPRTSLSHTSGRWVLPPLHRASKWRGRDTIRRT